MYMYMQVGWSCVRTAYTFTYTYHVSRLNYNPKLASFQGDSTLCLLLLHGALDIVVVSQIVSLHGVTFS